MTTIASLTTHILRHAQAEQASNDLSQIVGKDDRAVYAINVFKPYLKDKRDVDVYKFLKEVAGVASISISPSPLCDSFLRLLVNIDLRDEKEYDEKRPQLAIQAWIGKDQEQRNVDKTAVIVG